MAEGVFLLGRKESTLQSTLYRIVLHIRVNRIVDIFSITISVC